MTEPAFSSTEHALGRLLGSRDALLADGAIGTNLFADGLATGDAPELWNVDRPDRIERLHRAFVEAGSDIVLTNSFGGNRPRLALHGAQERVVEINVAAARIARAAVADAGREVLVAGSMGPTGEILAPNGPLAFDTAREVFASQARALADGGVDLIWIETMSAAEEIEAAVSGAATAGLPIVVTVSIDTNGRTMMGLTAADAARLVTALEAPVVALGSNCGVGAAEVVAATVNLAGALGDGARGPTASPLIVAKANCGIPSWVDGRIVYDGTPELMADYATLAIDAGARVVGGCCGTTPAHVAAMRAALARRALPGPLPDAEAIVGRLGEISHGARAQLGGDLSVAGGSASGRGGRPSRRRRR